jgi:hypothetical protein
MIKNHEVQFKNNQFVNQQTKQVLHLKPNRTFFIQGDDENFLQEDFLDMVLKPLDNAEKNEQIKSQHKKDFIEKLADSGTEFYIKFGLGRHTEEEDKLDAQYVFKAIILEDLYMRSKNKNKWRMCSCVCEVRHKISGKLDFEFETVEANSLSELFANLISTYFNRKRSTACNAFTDFYVANDSRYSNLKESLDSRRKALVAKANHQ